MKRIAWVALSVLLCAGCGGGISSYSDAMEAQLGVMEEMVDVLEGVTDEASAKAARSKIEALGKRAVEVAEQMQKLPQPEPEELQKIMEKYGTRTKEFQVNASTQMMKLAEYPELMEAYASAVSGMN